jgi:peptide/nickel transport system permease protein
LQHWAGTDAVGRDIWSRIVVGAGLSLLAAGVIISVSILVGSVAGMLAGALGGWVDAVFMRTTDLFLALPAPVLAIAVAGALGRSFEVTLIAVTVVWWPLYARIVRGETRALMARPHVEAARLSGSSSRGVFVRHVLPGTFPPVIVAASLDIGLVVLTLAGLSFLGLGSPEPSPELGAMAAQGLNYLLSRWWIPVMPALMVFVLAYLANLAGDALRDVLNKG